MLKEEIDATRRSLHLGRRPFAALLEVSPYQLLEIERGLTAPPSGFEERLQDLRANVSLVRRLTADRPVARRIRPNSIVVNGPWIGMLVLIVGDAILDLHVLAPHRTIFLAVLMILLVWAIARRTVLARCSHCLQHVIRHSEQCGSCGARLE